MKIDPLRTFLRLQKSLHSEKSRIERRLAELNRILGASADEVPSRVVRTASRKRAKARNSMSLRDAVIQVTTGEALSRPEILEAVAKLGYRFRAANPINSLGVLLYGNKELFKNQGGKFSAIESAAPQTASPKPAKVKNKMSAAGRAKIAAAQKARSAKDKSETKAVKTAE